MLVYIMYTVDLPGGAQVQHFLKSNWQQPSCNEKNLSPPAIRNI